MKDAPLYLDTSALVKLILDEDESPRVEQIMRGSELSMVSSQLAEVELIRAVSRSRIDLRSPARKLLERLILLPLTSSIRDLAGSLEPPTLRSLDAIHLATAFEIRDHLAGVVTFDRRMGNAAATLGLRVVEV